MNFIELENISFTYEGETEPVFKNFSLSINRGECLIIAGENGSGKTTLFRILNGLSMPSAGDYSFDGGKINSGFLKSNANAKLFHKRIGFMFQNPDVMLFNSRVYDEIAFGPRQMGITDAEVDERVKDCLKIFDIEKLADKAPYHLSYGQKKKVAMASVIALNPEVLVLDEPFAGLDRNNQESLLKLLSELKRAGKTIIMATHEFDAANTLADRTITL